MDIVITRAERDELRDVAAFLHDSWKTEYSEIISPYYLGSMTVKERRERLLDRFDKGLSDFFTVRDGGRLIGSAVFGKSFTDSYPDDGEISAIYLHRDYIGKRYGSALLLKIEEALSSKGYTYFVLDVLTANTRAVSFYQRHGYVKVLDTSIKLGAHSYPLSVFRKRNPVSIRRETPGDRDAVYEVTKAAFAGAEHSDEDEHGILEPLRNGEGFVPELSLVAELGGRIVGHIMFVETTAGGRRALILAIVSVSPEFQRHGIGGALVHAGHEAAKALGFSFCLVVGHENYYPRFGYEPISAHSITFPFEVPDGCAMVKFLDESGRSVSGAVQFPPELMP